MGKYELKKCPCCGEEPELFGEGLAKKYFEDGEWKFCFTDFDGYSVECSNCLKRTEKRHFSADTAVEEWNNME